jgi:hypothetical protein
LLEVLLVNECDMSADHGWNDTNRGSRIIRAETVANLEQTNVTARHTANLQLKLADDD